ncbi:MAG: hypothetical protein HY704_09705 [Gemmatimonadetes bacterium]|nr:hypothetical protein [Gemmatimonadota bacterium]
MIIVRDIFQLQFGKAREAVALMKEGQAILSRMGYTPARLLSDVTGEYYTLVMETLFDSLADFEGRIATVSQSQDWRNWYGRFQALVRSGRREIFRVVE